jgi:hypothetical protein
MGYIFTFALMGLIGLASLTAFWKLGLLDDLKEI